MKTELIIPEKVEEKRTFPLLAQSKYDGLIARFTSEWIGTLLMKDGLTINHEFYDSRASCFDESKWIILPPGTQVVLTQE